MLRGLSESFHFVFKKKAGESGVNPAHDFRSLGDAEPEGNAVNSCFLISSRFLAYIRAIKFCHACSNAATFEVVCAIIYRN